MTPNADPQSPAPHAAGAASRAGSDVRPLNAIVLKRALALYEQAAFLWTSRRAVVCSSAVTLDDLTRFDDHLSRLVYTLAERPALSTPLSLQEAGPFKTGQSFVTAIVALRSSVTSVVDTLLDRLEGDADLLSPLCSALAWLEYREVRPHFDRFLTSSSPALGRLAIMALVAHRRDPGAALDAALASADVSLRATAIEAVGRLGADGRLPVIAGSLDEPDEMLRFWAAWSAARFGDRRSIPVLGRFVTAPGPFARGARDIALRVLDSNEALRAHSRLAAGGSRKLAVAAAGTIGDPRLATWLLDAMESPDLARRAGAAFSLMTGCDPRRSDLDTGRPAAITTGTSDDDAAGDPPVSVATNAPDVIADEAEDDLVWPDVARIRRWWEVSHRAFAPAVRHVAGVPVRATEMAQVLRSGNQQQRAAAAMELALLDRGAVLLDVTGPAHRQRMSI